MSYADRNPKQFPGGGKRALADAVGALLGIRIPYVATMNFVGFIKMIDAVGGVDIDVKEAFNDPTYDGYGLTDASGKKVRGWSVTTGWHHFDGVNALAYARSRKALGESDFKRQERQQEILLALKNKVTQTGSLLFNLPRLLDALGDTVTTDFPVDQLPSAAAVIDEMGRNTVTRVVIKFPLVRGGNNAYGSVQFPDIAAIRAMAAGVFSTPGTPPTPWPTPKPTKAPAGASASPSSAP
jgi:LCP family protein required for cell wall assembly